MPAYKFPKQKRRTISNPPLPYLFNGYDFTTFTNLLAFPFELLMFTRA